MQDGTCPVGDTVAARLECKGRLTYFTVVLAVGATPVLWTDTAVAGHFVVAFSGVAWIGITVVYHWNGWCDE